MKNSKAVQSKSGFFSRFSAVGAQDTARVLLVALSYFAAHQLAFLFPDTQQILAAIWPAGGIGLAALLLNRRRLWFPILAAMFIAGNAANLLAGRPLFNSLGFMTANVLESLMCAWVIIYFCGESVKFIRVKEVLALIFAVVIVNAGTALIGAGTAALASLASFWDFWKTWWVVDGLGMLIVTPLIVAWLKPRESFLPQRWERFLESGLFLALWSTLTWLAFQGKDAQRIFTPQPYLLVVLLAYAALRFSLRGATSAITILSVIIILSKSVSVGPLLWGGDTLVDRLLLAQVFIGSITITGYLLSSAFTEREQALDALRHSQSFMNSIIEQSPTSLWISDERGTLLRMNQACRDILHLRDEEVVSKYNVFNDNLVEAQGFMPLVRDVFEKGVAVRFIISYDTAAVKGLELGQTTKVVLDVNISPILDPQGKVTNAIVQHIDITERMQAEEKINELNRDFVSFLENTSDFIYFKDENSRFRFCSQTLADITGHASWRDMIGKHDLEVFPKETGQIYYAEELPIFNEGKPLLNKVNLYYDTAGNKGWVNTNKWPLLDDSGKVVGLFGISRDVTERKRMEDALQASEERYRRLVENAPDIVYTFSNQRGGIYYSSRVKQVLGYSAEYLYAHPMLWNESIHPDDRPRISEILRDFEVGKVFDVEYRIRDARGNWLWLRDRSIGRTVDQSEVLVEGLATNITEQKRADEAVRASLVEKETLLKEVHHRVKNNLASISGLIGLQQEQLTDATVIAEFEELNGRIRSMALIHEMLYRSKNLSRIDLEDYFETLVFQLRASYDPYAQVRLSVIAVGVEMDLDHAIPCGLIINELVTNAFKYAFPRCQPRFDQSECTITVTAAREGNDCLLTVCDNGVGFPAGFDWNKAESLGLKLVVLLGQYQLKGQLELDRTVGTVFRLRFALEHHEGG